MQLEKESVVPSDRLSDVLSNVLSFFLFLFRLSHLIFFIYIRSIYKLITSL